MIELVSAHVWKYKSIEDSTAVKIEEDVTVLVGKNESGKSAFLEALNKTLPVGQASFNVVFDYPRRDYVRYRAQHEAKNFANVVQLTFRIDQTLVNKINADLFQGVQVIPPNFSFSRTSTYGNTSNVDLPARLNQVAALESLKKPFEGIEKVDEVFAGCNRLDQVVSKIEALKLPPENLLAAFAKKWRDRIAGASAGWDMLSWHIWNAYANPSMPKFLYFDDYNLLVGKINLDSLQQRKDNKQLTQSDETVFGLFDLAGVDLKELMSEEGYENSKAKLEAIGLTITQEVFEFWKQNTELSVEFDVKADPTDQAPFNNGKNLYIRIKNTRHGVTVPFDQRSKGFIWFFSFMVWFSAVADRVGTSHPLILLLDEPGLNLHALAQRDFLTYIEKLSESHQIIYSTHSPFMVQSDKLERVRVVEDRLKDGTKVTAQLEGSGDESLFPLQAALGYSIAQNLFIAKKNVLIEGVADLVVLQHMGALLEGHGKQGLNEGVFVPVGGLDKLVTFIALLGASKLSLAVLHDRAAVPNQKLEELIQRKLIERKRVLDYSMFREPKDLETDMEDLFPEDLYLKAFNEAYEKELGGNPITSAELGQHPRIIEKINEVLRTRKLSLLKDGGFNHYRVAQALLPKLDAASLPAESIAKFEELFARINAILR